MSTGELNTGGKPLYATNTGINFGLMAHLARMQNLPLFFLLEDLLPPTPQSSLVIRISSSGHEAFKLSAILFLSMLH